MFFVFFVYILVYYYLEMLNIFFGYIIWGKKIFKSVLDVCEDFKMLIN